MSEGISAAASVMFATNLEFTPRVRGGKDTFLLQLSIWWCVDMRRDLPSSPPSLLVCVMRYALPSTFYGLLLAWNQKPG